MSNCGEKFIVVQFASLPFYTTKYTVANKMEGKKKQTKFAIVFHKKKETIVDNS